jgi:hypothetical protein
VLIDFGQALVPPPGEGAAGDAPSPSHAEAAALGLGPCSAPADKVAEGMCGFARRLERAAASDVRELGELAYELLVGAAAAQTLRGPEPRLADGLGEGARHWLGALLLPGGGGGLEARSRGSPPCTSAAEACALPWLARPTVALTADAACVVWVEAEAEEAAHRELIEQTIRRAIKEGKGAEMDKGLKSFFDMMGAGF